MEAPRYPKLVYRTKEEVNRINAKEEEVVKKLEATSGLGVNAWCFRNFFPCKVSKEPSACENYRKCSAYNRKHPAPVWEHT